MKSCTRYSSSLRRHWLIGLYWKLSEISLPVLNDVCQTVFIGYFILMYVSCMLKLLSSMDHESEIKPFIYSVLVVGYVAMNTSMEESKHSKHSVVGYD